MTPPARTAGDAARFRVRLTLALLAGVFGGALAAHTQFANGPYGGDYRVVWAAARSVVHGVDPYGLSADGIVPDLARRFFYPLPAAVFGLPFAWLTAPVAAVCFAAGSAAFLMFAVTRDGFERAPVVLGIPFILASKISQTTPLVTALALTPSLAGLSLLKPNLGAAFLARWPRPGPVVACVVLCVGASIAFPDWPTHWLATVRSSTVHAAPFKTSLGAIGLLALLRWRRPEARLLFVMTIIPHGLSFYDEIPLWLVANSRREAMVLTLSSWIACLGWLTLGDAHFMHSGAWSTAFLYVPAAVMVLRRPNEGEIPAWMERSLARLPAFWRGARPVAPAAVGGD
jgi:hypothetical protein